MAFQSKEEWHFSFGNIFFSIQRYIRFCIMQIGSLSTRVFEMRTVTGSEQFSLLTCPHTTTFTLLSIFSPLETSSIKIWETIQSQHEKYSLQVAVRVSNMPLLKLPNEESDDVIGGSLKQCNTQSTISPEVLEHCSSNLAPEMYITRETERHLLCCCHGNTLGSSQSSLQSVKKQISPFAIFLSGTEGLAQHTHGSHIALTIPIRLL